MPRKRDYIDEIIKQGARVLPKPKPAAIPEPVPEPAAVPIIQPEPVAEAVARLQKCWHNPEPQPEPSKAQPTPEYAEYEKGWEPMIGDICDLIVVAFSSYDPTGRERGGIGLARPEGSNKGKRNGCHFVDRDVISEGAETLKPGSRIRARLAEAISTAHPFSLQDIEAYRE